VVQAFTDGTPRYRLALWLRQEKLQIVAVDNAVRQPRSARQQMWRDRRCNRGSDGGGEAALFPLKTFVQVIRLARCAGLMNVYKATRRRLRNNRITRNFRPVATILEGGVAIADWRQPMTARTPQLSDKRPVISGTHDELTPGAGCLLPVRRSRRWDGGAAVRHG